MTVSSSAHVFTMRVPCVDCECAEGIIATVNGQDTVRCADCGRFCYNAPRCETGRSRRSLRSRPNVSPAQRNRILLRDNGACVTCHRSDRPLQIAHIISVCEGKALGLSDAELFDDENLAAMCDECNAGQGAETLPLPFLVAVLRVRIARKRPQAS